MKLFIVICLIGLASVAIAAPKEYYTDKYDNINVQEIIENRRLLLPYIKCALDQGKCSASGKEMRDHIEDAMQTDCAKCTDKQKDKTKTVLKHVIRKETDYWNQLKAKYDPGNKYSPKYEKEAEEWK